jgi:hypothetical protein
MKGTIAALAVLFLASCLAYAASPAPPAQAAGIQIDEAKLGKDVKDRQIVDETADFALNDKVYLWLKVTSGSGESLKVTWKTGDHAFESELTVGGSPWRTWCYKTAAIAGDWTVTVADAKGTVLKEMNFKVK